MRFRNPLADGEAQTGAGALARARTRGIGAPEAVEHVGQVAGGDADARVRHGEDRPPVAAAELDRDLAAARRVLHGVLDEIERQLPHAAAIHRHDDRLGRQPDVDADAGMLGQELARLPRLFDDLSQVDRLTMQLRPALVGAGQRQQRVQELGHPIDLLQRLLQRGERLRWRIGTGDGALDARADDGEWCLQLVARVGGEPPQRREAAFQACHHLIQRLGQPAQLVALDRYGEPPV